MAGAALEIDARQLGRIQRAMLALSSTRFDTLADVIGTEVESQTRRRIEEEKRGPDGEPWAAWSERYARTRHSGHSLLQNEDHLLDSIHHIVEGLDIEVGSNLIYARPHQEGAEDLPARPFLGLSDENERDMLSAVDDFLGSELAGAGLT